MSDEDKNSKQEKSDRSKEGWNMAGTTDTLIANVQKDSKKNK